MKGARPSISTSRAVAIFEEMVEYRREYCVDTDFFRMPEILQNLFDDEGRWSIKFYQTAKADEFRPKAGVIAFADRVILSIDEKLFANARAGCRLSNFILAHEFGHLALDHHSRAAVTKHFQLQERPAGFANAPPTPEEYEANFAAVCFQCGVALQEPRWKALDLSSRASTDVRLVEKFQAMTQLGVFKSEMERQRRLKQQRPIYPKVVL